MADTTRCEVLADLNWIEQYAENPSLLLPAERIQLKDHLHECEACRRKYEQAVRSRFNQIECIRNGITHDKI